MEHPCLSSFRLLFWRSYWHVPRRINTVQDHGSSRNDNAALAYMLTNLVDATMAFQIVDIHQYMMESISVILQLSSPSGGVHIFATGVTWRARVLFDALICHTIIPFEKRERCSKARQVLLVYS